MANILRSNDPFKFRLQLTVDGTVIPTDSEVSAVIADSASAGLVRQLTEPVPVTWNAGLSRWLGEFPATETRKILKDPDNPKSEISYKDVSLLVSVEGVGSVSFEFTTARGAITT